MGQLAKYSPARGRWITHSPRPSRKRSQFPDPQGKRFSLSQPADDSQWEEIKTAPQCEAKAEISEGYKSAIALLRSLRNSSEEEAQRQRESWELLKHDLDENKYH